MDHLASPDKVFLTDAGIMTYATFQKGLTLGKELTFLEFMDDADKVAFFQEYYTTMARTALERGFHFMLESAATWKASLDLGVNVLGLSEEKWSELMAKSNDMVANIREDLMVEFPDQQVLIGGLIGAREGGYKTTLDMSEDEAAAYHEPAMRLFATDSRVDYVLAGPLADVVEAKGIIRAGAKHNMPLVISFTLRKQDCKLQSGQSLKVIFFTLKSGGKAIEFL